MGVKESIISIPEGKNTIKQINKHTDTSIQKIEELKNQIDILKNKITNIPKGDRRVSELNTEIYKLRQNIADMEVKINIRKNQKTADKNNINYYNMLLTQNKTIKKEYDNLKTMFDTGNQKTGYMTPYVEKFQKIKNVLFIVYFLVVIIYAYFIYFPWSWDKLTTKTLYMLLFVAFPYIISFVELHLINMFRFLYSFIFDIPFRKFHM
jgi:regulator of replication initiation timing